MFPKRLLIRKLIPNKRKNLSPFRTDVPIRLLVLRTLGAGVTRNREIMKLVRILVSNIQHRLWIIYSFKTVHNQLFIVSSD